MGAETMIRSDLPPVVTAERWWSERERLLEREKELTRASDALAAERRRLPMVAVRSDYAFEGPAGPADLVDLFEGRAQLIVYHFMLGPDAEVGCAGCSMFVDNLGHLAHLNARDTTLALVSRAPLAKLEAFKRRMGWGLPWYSSHGSEFNRDFGVTGEDGRETFGLSVFVRDARRVFRTYFTDGRGAEALSSNWALLDVTPLGRQEEWQQTPRGRPQGPPYAWWRLHDEYGPADEGEAR
jgi:predicted dithiol-disulfide oxidoreductase (DUF899 family)